MIVIKHSVAFLPLRHQHDLFFEQTLRKELDDREVGGTAFTKMTEMMDKMDKMMKQLAHETSESESESEDEAPAPPVRQRQQSPPPIAYSTIAPQRQPVRRQQPYNIQTQSQQRTDYLRQLALAYYS
jgi:hypothetical protein